MHSLNHRIKVLSVDGSLFFSPVYQAVGVADCLNDMWGIVITLIGNNSSKVSQLYRSGKYFSLSDSKGDHT